MDSNYFSANSFGDFLRFGKNQEIQDSGTKMAAVWKIIT